MMVSVQCGCSGSTTGGIKVDRVLISIKAVISEIRRRLHPAYVNHVRLGQHLVPENIVSGVMMYIVLYLMVILVSVLAVMLTGSDAFTSVSGVVASLGSVGPGLGELGCMDNYSAQPAMAKFIYAFDMFLGRIEIYPVLIVLSMIIGRKK